jgi:uncharacterized membrane protein
MGLLRKNEYGEYLVKQKTNMKGFIWIGRRLVSKMLLYASIFIGVLGVELIILAWHFNVETSEFKVFFALLMIITAVSAAIFGIEAVLQKRKFIQSLKTE